MNYLGCISQQLFINGNTTQQKNYYEVILAKNY